MEDISSCWKLADKSCLKKSKYPFLLKRDGNTRLWWHWPSHSVFKPQIGLCFKWYMMVCDISLGTFLGLSPNPASCWDPECPATLPLPSPTWNRRWFDNGRGERRENAKLMAADWLLISRRLKGSIDFCWLLLYHLIQQFRVGERQRCLKVASGPYQPKGPITQLSLFLT